MSSAIWSMVKVVTLISLLIFGHHLIIIFKIASEQWIIWAAIVALMLFVLAVINYLTSLQISTSKHRGTVSIVSGTLKCM